MNNIKIELHLLQNFPPSCLNRDDANMPKDCYFGGKLRARISSQCLKSTARKAFRENNEISVGWRTKKLVEEIDKNLPTDVDLAERGKVLNLFVKEFYSKMDTKKPDSTAVLTFISSAEIAECAKCIVDFNAVLTKAALSKSQKKKGQESDSEAEGEAENESNVSKKEKSSLPIKVKSAIADRLKSAALSADIALFGRMLAEHPDFNANAACQVAHAISTHEVSPETDFFTAVDDLNVHETGAGMMGVQGFNSACFYRYAAIDRDLLVKNLKGDAAMADQAIRAFLKASLSAVPNAKKNSSGQNCTPSLGLFVVRSHGPLTSLVNAFVSPVVAELDLIKESKKKLDNYFGKAKRVFGSYEEADLNLYHDGEDEDLDQLSAYVKPSIKESVDATMAAIAARAESA